MSTHMEIRAPPKFPSFIALEYDEFNPEWFDEIMSLTQTKHRAYCLKGNNTLQILIGVTHPIEFEITAEPEKITELVQNLRLKYGFKKARWAWK